MEVGLLGGAFNPPHIGHWLAAHYARATQPLDQVWLMPAYRHPFGKSLIDFEHRLRMCEAICSEASGWLKVSEAEREVNGVGWTVEILKHLLKKDATTRFTVIVGSDVLPDLPRWKSLEEIKSLARLLVLHRAGFPAAGAVGPPLALVSSSEVRERIEKSESVEDLVPRAVLAYAQRHRLYGLSP